MIFHSVKPFIDVILVEIDIIITLIDIENNELIYKMFIIEIPVRIVCYDNLLLNTVFEIIILNY